MDDAKGLVYLEGWVNVVAAKVSDKPPPTDRSFLALCCHDDGYENIDYGYYCYSSSYVEDGWHVLAWEPESCEWNELEGRYHNYPGCWFLNSDFETTANPIYWVDLEELVKNFKLIENYGQKE